MNKQKLSERDICTKFITPALIAADLVCFKTIIRHYAFEKPPLAEQRRIVAKVDELMAVLDALAAALITARTAAAALLAATVAKLTVSPSHPLHRA